MVQVRALTELIVRERWAKVKANSSIPGQMHAHRPTF